MDKNPFKAQNEFCPWAISHNKHNIIHAEFGPFCQSAPGIAPTTPKSGMRMGDFWCLARLSEGAPARSSFSVGGCPQPPPPVAFRKALRPGQNEVKNQKNACSFFPAEWRQYL